jgi:hypothetical protein
MTDLLIDDQGNELEPLDELEYELGGLRFKIGDAGDEGLDDIPEVEGDDEAGAGDGAHPAYQRLASREIKLTIPIAENGTGDTVEERFAQFLHQLRIVLSPLPDRYATRLLRFRRLGEVAKRIAVRPATGQKPLTVKGADGTARARLQFSHAVAEVYLEAFEPAILSDLLHREELVANTPTEIVNAGSFCSVLPTNWALDYAGTAPLVLEHLDFDEYMRFPAGPLTVSTRLEIEGPGTYGLVYGPGGQVLVDPILLRPGANSIRASQACTFDWRDTW